MLHKPASLSLVQIREKLTNVILSTAAAFVLIALFSSLLRVSVTGLLPVMMMHIVLSVFIVMLFLYRHKVSTVFKASAISSMFFIGGTVGIHTFGLSGNGIYLLFAASLFASFILSIQIASAIAAAGGLVILTYAVLVGAFGFEFAIEQSAYSLNSNVWVTTLVVYCYCLGIFLFLIHNFFEYLKALLSQQQTTIQSQSSRIETSQAILDTIINNLPYGILWKDKNLRYLGANKVFLRDQEVKHVDSIIGKTDHDFISKSLAEKFARLDHKLLMGEEASLRYEEKVTNDEGESVYFEVSRLPLRTKQGALIGVLTSYHDVTAHKNLEIQATSAREEAERASRTKSQFLANMSHDIRTPINGVMGLIDICLHTELSQQQRYYLTRADFSARLLLNIINDVLDLSKIEAGQIDLESLPFQFDALLAQLNEMFAEQAHSKAIGFQTTMQGQNKVTVLGDPTRILQIMMNLCSNAIKFTERGEVNVTTKLVADHKTARIAFTVSDTGIGIPHDSLSYLFDNFTQSDESITRKYGGTGLGLSIVKQLVELMHGTVSVKSEISKGSSFTVLLTLPRGQYEATDAPKREQPVDLTGIRILLVEDNEINQEVAATVLEQNGAQVTIAQNGEEGLACLASAHFDLVLMDIQMPVMDGCTAIKIMRKDDRFKTLPVIALTANVLANEIAYYSEVGFSEHVGKPFEREVLLAVVKRCVQKSKQK